MKEMTTREIQLICLDLLKDVHKFCVENNIKYSLSGGSLIGAVRHNGFIPWDDDADIQMPRPDYDKFIATYRTERGYKLYARETGGRVFSRIARLFEVDKTYVDQTEEPLVCEKVGVWIDIIPVDGAPSNKREAIRYIRALRRGEIFLSCLSKTESNWTDVMKLASPLKKLKFIVKKIIGVFIHYSYVDRYIKFAKKYEYSQSEYFYATPHYGMNEWQPKKYMEGYELFQFEDTLLYIMSGYNDNLTRLYGDYMKIPSKDKQVTHEKYKRYWK